MPSLTRICLLFLAICSSFSHAEPPDFEKDVRPLLAMHCVKCHGAMKQEGGLRLDAKSFAFKGGDGGAVILAAQSAKSELIRRIMSNDAEDRMPPEGKQLAHADIELLKKWIDTGANWDETDVDRAAMIDPRRNHWAWSKLERPSLPKFESADNTHVRTPVDVFILHKLREKGLTPSPEADRRTLIRRVYFDLVGLPPKPEDVEAFVRDEHPRAYEALVESLLASPHYGERWARHWLDVVHYGDTHGYDKDQPRHNAWPYRDYVIRSLNNDKLYSRFIQEQIAGDVLFPDTVDGVEALGFIAAGPWDLIGHTEVPESKIDGKIARMLDRDDMVANTMSTFTSLTVQCARCHDHKFDPVTQEDYYSLQAVFAAIDRAPKTYDSDPAVAEKRRALQQQRTEQNEFNTKVHSSLSKTVAEQLSALDHRIKQLREAKSSQHLQSAAFGYHSQIAAHAETAKWVQLDLGKAINLSKIVLQPCHDTFNNIGDGFGFPVRFKVELSNDAKFTEGVVVVADYTQSDYSNPKLLPVEILINQQRAQYIRITATKLATRMNDYHLAIAELQVFNAEGKNVASSGTVSAFDSIEAPPRWLKANLIDGYYPSEKMNNDPHALAALEKERSQLFESSLDQTARETLAQATAKLAEIDKIIASLPPLRTVYAGTIHNGTGAFAGTGPQGGKPRVIHILKRGNVLDPGTPVTPGTLNLVAELPARFEISATAPEGERRAALARWLSDKRNPLPWRSIVNRVWEYHFGRGIVDSPNDFGRMGQSPSHPELLDWLAVEFRDGGQSLKSLHRLIVNSASYRQASFANPRNSAVDSGNVYLWRMNRRRLEAEAIRDSVLGIAGKLNLDPGGPGFQDFVIEHPTHSPHYQYHLHDSNDPKSHRRSIYRFIVRSQPHPFMTTLDCADPSMSVDKRNESLTPLQALTLLNNRFMVTMAEHFAKRLETRQDSLETQIVQAFQLALARSPTPSEREKFIAYAQQHGLPSACRVMFNLSEFVFID